MITAQLILSGTPQELQEALIRLNGTMSTTEPEEVIEKPKKAKQTKMDLPKVDETEVTIEELRSEIQAKAKDGKRDDIKKLLKEFGAASVTELDEEHYGEFKLKLDKL